MRKTLLLAALILLPSCAGTGAGPEGCVPWRPILVSDADVLTPETARAILAHNLTGRRICGW
jgi:hypothetical protein